MTIQDVPTFFDMVFSEKDGTLAPDGYLYNDQLNQVLHLSVNDLNGTTSTFVQQGAQNPYGFNPVPQPGQLVIIGLNPPSLTTAQIAAIIAASPQVVPYGTIFYDNEIDKLYVFLRAGLQEIQSM